MWLSIISTETVRDLSPPKLKNNLGVQDQSLNLTSVERQHISMLQVSTLWSTADADCSMTLIDWSMADTDWSTERRLREGMKLQLECDWSDQHLQADGRQTIYWFVWSAVMILNSVMV